MKFGVVFANCKAVFEDLQEQLAFLRGFFFYSTEISFNQFFLRDYFQILSDSWFFFTPQEDFLDIHIEAVLRYYNIFSTNDKLQND